MTFSDVIRNILRSAPEGLTPQQIRDVIKKDYPDFYGTESHKRNVEKGHYGNIEHALLAQIYVVPRYANDILTDKSVKPMKFMLLSSEDEEDNYDEDSLATEDLEKLEDGIGTLYILGTNLFTKQGEELIKIGITTGSVENRINQLYNTSVPEKFRVIKKVETKNYAELEQSMHKIFDPFRINRSREYFTARCLRFVDALFALHEDILRSA